MTFLPIVARELRAAARRRSTYWVRSGAAVVVIAVGAWFFIVGRDQPAHEVAITLFAILTGSSVLYCLFSGVRFTADCLSEEKRDGTLGLLFLTDLKGYDVVLGKLAANSLNGFYGVLAVVPMLALPLLMGGVTPGEFGRMAMVAINALFYSLSLGICVSAVSRSARSASGLTVLLILFWTALLPALGACVANVMHAKQPPMALMLPSVGVSYLLAFDRPYNAMLANEFWWSLLVVHGLGWLFLVLASLIVPHAWQERPAGGQRLRWRQQWHLWSFGSVAERAAFRTRLLDQNAYFWLAARARLRPVYLWVVLGLIACFWAWGVAKYHRDWLNPAMYFTTGVLLNLLIKVWFASEAGRQLAEDRKQGALELLLSTPLTVQEVMHGQWLALRRQFLGPVGVVLVVFFCFMMGAFSEMTVEDDRSAWVLFWVAAISMMVADLAGLYWVGMWEGLTSKNPNRAMSASLLRILVLPFLGFALVSLFVSLLSLKVEVDLGPKFFLGCWWGLSVVADLGFGLWSRHQLLTAFRVAATQRYSSEAGLWRRFFGRANPAAGGVELRRVSSR